MISTHYTPKTFKTKVFSLAECDQDFVAVYTDPTSHESPSVFCAKSRPDPKVPIVSVGNEMLVHFVTDDFFSNAEGFSAKYEVIDQDGMSILASTAIIFAGYMMLVA